MNKKNKISTLILLLSIVLIIGGTYFVMNIDIFSPFNMETPEPSHNKENFCSDILKQMEAEGAYHYQFGWTRCWRDIVNKEFGCIDRNTKETLCFIQFN